MPGNENLRSALRLHGRVGGEFGAPIFRDFLGELADDPRLPLRCFEVGASAGLNLYWDRFRYELGDVATWGDPASPVVCPADWNGPLPPLDAPIRVIERAACDRRPSDLTDPVQRR